VLEHLVFILFSKSLLGPFKENWREEEYEYCNHALLSPHPIALNGFCARYEKEQLLSQLPFNVTLEAYKDKKNQLLPDLRKEKEFLKSSIESSSFARDEIEVMVLLDRLEQLHFLLLQQEWVSYFLAARSKEKL
jgi:hypothetical protein